MNRPDLLVLDAEIARAEGRCRTLVEVLKRHAGAGVDMMQRIVTADTWQDAADEVPSPMVMQDVLRYQARLDEALRDYGALTARRANLSVAPLPDGL